MSFTLQVGLSQQLTCTFIGADGSTLYGIGAPVWSSADPSIVSVNAVGLATAVASGTVTVVAALGGLTGATTVTVTDLALLSEDGLALLLESGETVTTEG